jgi:hypothetical protein
MRTFRDRLPWTALVVSLIVSAGRDAALLFRYPVAAGIDGYYYVLQINQFTRISRFHFTVLTPLILYALTAFAHLTGNPITAIKVGGVLLHLLLCLGIFAIINSTLRNPWLGVLGSAMAVIPQSHLYMTTEYVNQLGALVLLIWSGWITIRAVQTRRRVWILIVAALLIGALFSHKSILVFAPTLALCVLLLLGLTRSGIWKRLAGLATILLWLGPAIVSAQPFFPLPEWMQRQLSLRPHWPFEPALLAEGLMLAIAAFAVLLLVVWLAPKTGMSGFNLVFGSIALWSLMVTLNPFFNAQAMLSSVAGRSRVFSYIQVALLVPGLIWLAVSVRREAAIYVGAVFIPLLILSALAPLPYGLQPEFLARRGKLIQSTQDSFKRGCAELNHSCSSRRSVRGHGNDWNTFVSNDHRRALNTKNFTGS